MIWRGQVFKKWAGFSFSETRALFWTLLGPFFIMLTLAVAPFTFSNFYLSLIAIIGSVFCCKRGMKGFFSTLIVLGGAFVLVSFCAQNPFSIWQIGWGVSFVLGLTVTFLSIEEVRNHANQKIREREKNLKTLQAAKQKALIEKQALEKEVENLKKSCAAFSEEVAVLSNLVEASRVESEKLERRVEILSLESIQSERELNSLREDLEQARQSLKGIQEEPVTHSVQMVKECSMSKKGEGEKYFALKTLEKNKSEIKKAYDQALKEYQKMMQDVRETPSIAQKKLMGKKDKKGAPLNVGVADKQKKLEEAKLELIGIEREIFMIKKELQQEHSLAR